MLTHYSELISLYRLRILIGAIVAGVLALSLSYVLLKTSPSYTAEVTLNMQPSEEALLFNRQFLGQSQFNPATIITQTHIERLLSRPMAEKSLAKLLAANPGSDLEVPPTFVQRLKLGLWIAWTRLNFGEYRPLPESEQLLNEFAETLEVDTVEGSYILLISATHKFPTIATQIANTLAETYIETASSDFATESLRAADVFRTRVAERETELEVLYASRNELRNEYDISDINMQAEILLTSAASVREELTDDQLTLQLKQNERRVLEDGLGTGGAASRGKIQTLDDEITVLAAQIAFRQDLVSQLSASLSELSNRETEFANLNTEIDAVRADLSAVRQQLLSFELGVQTQSRQIQLVSPAVVPVYPSSPKMLVNTVVAVIVGSLLVFMAAVMQDILGAPIRTNSDLIAAVGDRALPTGTKKFLKSLGGIPTFRKLRHRRRLRQFIQAFGQKMSVESGWNKPGLLITGYLPQEDLIEVGNFFAEVIRRSVSKPGIEDEFRVSAVGPIHSIKDWDTMRDGHVIVVCGPDQKFDADLSGLKRIGKKMPREPLFIIWRG